MRSHPEGNHAQMQQCIDNCRECQRICLETMMYCLTAGGKHAAADHIRLLFDCTEICQTSANFMIRGSPLHTASCGACARVCQQCAEDCARFGDEAQMRRCAEACRRCADSGREMARAA